MSVHGAFYTCLLMYLQTHMCVLTLIKGLEFAPCGEFIITLIPLEKDSFAQPSHTYPSILSPADKMCCLKYVVIFKIENIM